MIEFGKRLKQIRHEKGLSQEFLAEKLGISRQAISKWESNTAQPDLENLVKLSEILDVSLDTLVGHNISEPTTNRWECSSFDCNAYKISVSYKKRAIVCALFPILLILFSYTLTIFKPELKIGNDARIMNMLELQFWTKSGLLPFLILSIGSIVLGVFFYYKYLISEQQESK